MAWNFICDAWKSYLCSFRRIALLAASVWLPFLLAHLTLKDFWESSLAASLAIHVLNLALSVLYLGATLHVLSCAHQGRGSTLKENLVAGAGRIVSLLLTRLLCIVAALFGLLLLIVPGVWIALRLSIAAPLAFKSGEIGLGPLKESFRMTKGKELPLLLAYFVAILLFLLLFLLMAALSFAISTIPHGEWTTRALSSVFACAMLVALSFFTAFSFSVCEKLLSSSQEEEPPPRERVPFDEWKKSAAATPEKEA